ncbi:MAG: hypothetical protein QW607_11355 [Desulfurococcaceae archaeon]
MNKTVKITIDLTNSPHITLNNSEASKLLMCLEREIGETIDLKESLRIISNFDEFYKYSKRKYRDYLTPVKNHRDSILGRTIVHKLKLFIENNNKFVEIVFDRRFNIDYLKKCLLEISYSNVIVEKQTI